MRSAVKHDPSVTRGSIPRLACMASWLVLALPAIGFSQSSGNGSGMKSGMNTLPNFVQPASPMDDLFNPSGSPDSSQFEKRLSLMNAQRQKDLVADTNKLLALVKELNEEVASSNSGELSPDQLRKVAEIEKLAHSVRDKMSESVRNAPPGLDMGPFLRPMR